MTHVVLGAGSAASSYKIPRSLRLNPADSPYLHRAFATPTSSSRWTMSMWVKRSSLGSLQALFGKTISSTANFYLAFDAANKLTWTFTNSALMTTAQVFRDCSAWYHVVAAWDSANATAALRARLYVNGTEVTAFSTDQRSSITTATDAWNVNNTAYLHAIGATSLTASTVGYFFGGYIAEVHFVDGRALDPSYFGETNSDTGVWRPKAFSAGLASDGFAGGNATNSAATETQRNSGGGGGGAGQAGADGGTGLNPAGGKGGDGVASSITGAAVTRGGGGGGACVGTGAAGAGGAGGGGAGASGASGGSGTAGTANTGGGGGGQSGISGSGGSGGSGVVIVRYPYAGATDVQATGGTITTSGGYRIHVFNASDTFQVTALSSTPSNNWLEYVVVGGGGGGYQFLNYWYKGGGGGGGGYRSSVRGELSGGGKPAETRVSLEVKSYPVVVGAGGAANMAGNPSSFDNIVAAGGGGGGGGTNSTRTRGGSGGGATATSYTANNSSSRGEPLVFSGRPVDHGANGVYLSLSDNSAATAAALGKDSSINGNSWTPYNLSVAAGLNNDSLTDTPTPYADGSNGRGNYCTLNPLDFDAGTGTPTVVTAMTQGNLSIPFNASAWCGYRSTFAVSSGKWYVEVDVSAGGTASSTALSVVRSANPAGQAGAVEVATVGTGAQTIAIALNLDDGTYATYRGNAVVSTGSIALGSSYCFRVAVGNSPVPFVNFGQRPFTYTPPLNYKALNAQNLPSPAIARPSIDVDVVTYTGTGAAQTPTSALRFTPSLVIIKSRSAATASAVYDASRGAQARVEMTSSAGQVTADGGLTAFNASGFSVGTLAQVNTASATYAAWCWDAGSSSVANSQGSVSSTVRANPTAGTSVVTFTSPASGTYTVGHGLGAAPSFIMVKNTGATANDWRVFHASVSTDTSKYLTTNDTTGVVTSAGMWGSALPTSQVFGSTAGYVVRVGESGVAYCFSAVAGFSAFGSYTGNGNANGPFVNLGFRPAVILVKLTSAAGEGWYFYDVKRSPYNQMLEVLSPSLSGGSKVITAEASNTLYAFDFLSNGFKVRATHSAFNTSGATYVYAAWAESPFKHSLAR